MKRLLGLLVIVASLFTPAMARAQYAYPQYRPYAPPAYRQAGHHRHDGFFLRTYFGVGYGRASDDLALDTEYSGTAGAFGLALGGAVAENLILFAELSDYLISDPSIHENGVGLGTADGYNLSAFSLGGGLAYYFMPVNVYLSGALSVTSVSMYNGNDTWFETNRGLGVHLMVGKEWWVSPNWGLGIALSTLFTRLKEDHTVSGIDANWTMTAFTLAFSATYN